MTSTENPARPTTRLFLTILAAVAVLMVAAGVFSQRLVNDPLRDLAAWNELDARWGTYLPER
jgi:hypothetical protein